MPYLDESKKKDNWRSYYAKNKSKILLRAKLWRIAHPERCKAIGRKSQRARRLKDPEKIREQVRSWRKLNREQHLARRRELRRLKVGKERARVSSWKKKNRAKIRTYERELRLRNPSFRLARNMRVRIHHALKGVSKSEATLKLLGCSIENLWIYLESKFETGMTRDNYGVAWEVDHIIPCALFDLTKPEHQARCFHFSNLQPMTGGDNKIKGAKLIADFSQ